MLKKEKKIENIAQEWLDLKNQKLLTEKRLDNLKPILETYLAEQPDKESEMCGFKFKLVNSERENFRLSEAKKKKGFWKLLKPFVTVSYFNQIRATFCGQEEEKQAA